jgi:hypothetical protein
MSPRPKKTRKIHAVSTINAAVVHHRNVPAPPCFGSPATEAVSVRVLLAMFVLLLAMLLARRSRTTRRPRGRRSAKWRIEWSGVAKTSAVARPAAALRWVVLSSGVLVVAAAPKGTLTDVEFKQATWGTLDVAFVSSLTFICMT